MPSYFSRFSSLRGNPVELLLLNRPCRFKAKVKVKEVKVISLVVQQCDKLLWVVLCSEDWRDWIHYTSYSLGRQNLACALNLRKPADLQLLESQTSLSPVKAKQTVSIRQSVVRLWHQTWILTRIHSSRMRTVRCSGCPFSICPGGCLPGGCLPDSPPCEQNDRHV